MDKRFRIGILGILLISVVSFIMGMSAITVIVLISDETSEIPVCHSITEDSDITDCSYQNGTWSTK